MFSAGTKVYVHTSSVVGKKLGPKRHSLGYISDADDIFFANHIKEFPIKHQCFIFVPTKIIFTRYGKEQKERSEAREFIQIIPVFLESISKESIVARIKEIIAIMNAGNLYKNHHWAELCSHYGDNTLNMGVVIPVGHTNPAPMRDNEAVSYINSVLRNRDFIRLIRYPGSLIKKQVNENVFSYLYQASRGNKATKELLNWAATPENMSMLLTTMRYLNTALSKRLLENNSSKIPKEMRDITSFSDWLFKGLFEGNRTLKRKEELLNKITLSNDKICLYQCARPTRDTYLNIKPQHV